MLNDKLILSHKPFQIILEIGVAKHRLDNLFWKVSRRNDNIQSYHNFNNNMKKK